MRTKYFNEGTEFLLQLVATGRFLCRKDNGIRESRLLSDNEAYVLLSGNPTRSFSLKLKELCDDGKVNTVINQTECGFMNHFQPRISALLSYNVII